MWTRAPSTRGAGLPVIATSAGQINEIITHTDNGILVDNGVEEIVSWIRYLQEHPEAAVASDAVNGDDSRGDD